MPNLSNVHVPTHSNQFCEELSGWQDSIFREPTVCIHLLLSLRLRVSEILFHGPIRTDVVRSDRKSTAPQYGAAGSLQ